MAQDVIITPASGKIEFNNSAGSLSVTIQESSGDLSILPTGDLIIGDGTPGNVEFGGSGVPVTVSLLGGGEISSGGNSLDIGITGDTINLNVSGVTYNFPGTITASLSGNATTATNISGYSGTYWTSNNDGTGSGLDADLLDGLQASQFLRSDADDIVSKQLTFPSAVGDRPILQGGFLSRLSGDGDADIWGISEDYYPSQGTASNAWGIRWASTPNEIQFVGANANKLRIDLDTAGKVYIDDNEVWHVGNDGSGSGLDADLLDGQQGSYYAAASSLGSYLPLTGGTLTGSLLFGTSTNDPSSPPLYIQHTALTVSPYTGLIIKNTSTIGNTYTGVAIDAYTQAHFRYLINGNLKWQTAVNSSDDSFKIYSWTSSANVLTLTTSGAVTASGDFRAPIFYDSANTAYYVDPASTSYLNRINFNTAATASIQWRPAGSGSTGIGIPPLASIYGSLCIEVSDNDTGGILIDNEGVSTYGAGDTGWIFRAIDEDVWQSNGNNVDAATIFGVGQGATGGTRTYGTASASVDMRAPIFYDSVSTTYWVDPGNSATSANFNGAVRAKNFDENIYTLTGTALDPGNGGIQYKTLSANTTFTNSFESGESMTLKITGGATYTVTWPTMTWITSGGNVAPTLNGTDDVIVMWYDGTTLYGLYAGNGA